MLGRTWLEVVSQLRLMCGIIETWVNRVLSLHIWGSYRSKYFTWLKGQLN
jgi:hypothetical protein